MSGSLAGTAWAVVDVDGVAPPDDGPPQTLLIGDDGRLSGHAGVNRYAGAYEVTEEGITPGPLMATRMAGTRAWNEAEHRFLAALAGPLRVMRTPDGLTLEGAAGVVRLAPASGRLTPGCGAPPPRPRRP
ncbi:MAG: META domain-containing protein [Thermoleophilia bacterium]